jgi:hypothetical protein
LRVPPSSAGLKYLEVIFSTRVMSAIIRKTRELNLSIDCQLDMFDKMVVPILLYGCEIYVLKI